MGLENIISKNLRKLREERGLSQKRLAQLAEIDVRQISKYENKPDHFSTKTIEKLANGLGISPAELLISNQDSSKEIQLPKTLAPGLSEAIQVLRLHLKKVKK